VAVTHLQASLSTVNKQEEEEEEEEENNFSIFHKVRCHVG